MFCDVFHDANFTEARVVANLADKPSHLVVEGAKIRGVNIDKTILEKLRRGITKILQSHIKSLEPSGGMKMLCIKIEKIGLFPIAEAIYRQCDSKGQKYRLYVVNHKGCFDYGVMQQYNIQLINQLEERLLSPSAVRALGGLIATFVAFDWIASLGRISSTLLAHILDWLFNYIPVIGGMLHGIIPYVHGTLFLAGLILVLAGEPIYEKLRPKSVYPRVIVTITTDLKTLQKYYDEVKRALKQKGLEIYEWNTVLKENEYVKISTVCQSKVLVVKRKRVNFITFTYLPSPDVLRTDYGELYRYLLRQGYVVCLDEIVYRAVASLKQGINDREVILAKENATNTILRLLW